MPQVYFTTLQGIKDNSLIDTNVADKTMLIMLRTAENIYCQEVLSTMLYSLLKSNILANTLTTKQRILIENYILPYIYALVEMLAVDDLLVKLNENGVNASTPDNTVQKSQKELQQIKTHKVKAVNFLCGLLKSYIENNIADFPEYNDITTGVPAKKINNFGFYCDDDDYIRDNNYNDRDASSDDSEGI